MLRKLQRDKWEIFTHGGREPNTGIDAIDFSKQCRRKWSWRDSYLLQWIEDGTQNWVMILSYLLEID